MRFRSFFLIICREFQRSRRAGPRMGARISSLRRKGDCVRRIKLDTERRDLHRIVRSIAGYSTRSKISFQLLSSPSKCNFPSTSLNRNPCVFPIRRLVLGRQSPPSGNAGSAFSLRPAARVSTHGGQLVISMADLIACSPSAIDSSAAVNTR